MEGAGIVRLEIVSFFAANGIVSFVVISQGKKRIGLPNRKGFYKVHSLLQNVTQEYVFQIIGCMAFTLTLKFETTFFSQHRVPEKS